MGNSLGRIIHDARTSKALSQTALGRLIHNDRSLISRWENDKRRPSEDQKKALAETLGIPEFDLVDDIEVQ